MSEIRVGIDTGGTFTDFVALMDGTIRTYKVPSIPDDPARAVCDGLVELLGDRVVQQVVHGSTVATNALLEKKGAKTALITTKGFEDVIEIGRQTRPRIYDIMVEKPPPLVAASDRYGLSERVGPFGEIEEEADPESVKAVIEAIRASDVEAVAVCLIHSYANPHNERRVEELLERAGNWKISSSFRILPEYREYERCSTIVVNAYVSVIMAGYLDRLGREIGMDVLRVMQSNGGFISADRASKEPVRTILSGPAGGVIGALEMGRRTGNDDIISFDMGGTSTDVCLCRGKINATTEAQMGGYPIRIPAIDVHTVGSGGGSIAWIDRGGALRVGPMSAGADPGPICYGVGEDLTVTDAHLFLGRLEGSWFLGGRIDLARDRVAVAMERLGREIGKTARETAMGIIEVANANMERAIRVISLERGHDPRDFTLVTFGGAGGLHACDIARDLAIRTILIPADPGAFSAKGLLMTDVVIDYSASVLEDWEDWQGKAAETVFSGLEREASASIRSEVGKGKRYLLERSVDMRYSGQSYELNVPWTESAGGEFHRHHERRFNYAIPGKPVEVVAARVRAVGELSRPDFGGEEPSGIDPGRAKVGEREIVFREGVLRSAVYQREKLSSGNRIAGPALVVEYTATSLVPPGFEAEVDRYGNLRLEEVN